jgi:hypothetical protein
MDWIYLVLVMAVIVGVYIYQRRRAILRDKLDRRDGGGSTFVADGSPSRSGRDRDGDANDSDSGGSEGGGGDGGGGGGD